MGLLAGLPDDLAVVVIFGLSVDFLDDDELSGAAISVLMAGARVIFILLTGAISARHLPETGLFEAVRTDGEALTERR